MRTTRKAPSPSAIEPAKLNPLPELPALLVEPGDPSRPSWIVVADLHLGLGAPHRQPEGLPESRAEDLAAGLIEASSHGAVTRVVIAGDVKHPIVGVPRPLRSVIFDFFSTLLAEGLEPEVVLGNHDVGLVRHLPKEVVVHSSSGLLRDGVGVFHGHTWPSSALLRAPQLIAGHLHPGFRFAATADAAFSKRRCWLRVQYPEWPAHRHRRRVRVHDLRARELIVLPAFNPLAGTESLNVARPKRSRTFLFQRFLAPGIVRAYLMDGTDLGPLPTLPEGDLPTGSGKVAPRGR
ncbi:MAG: hypothetical protein WCA77_08305 [Thermoplasmata archaeon]